MDQMYYIHISAEVFGEDNCTVFQMIKEYLINSPCWVCIERFNATESGREAFWVWLYQYNGQGGLSKRTHLSLATLKMLHYKK